MTITLNEEIFKKEIATFSALEKEVFSLVAGIGCQIMRSILENQDETLRKEREKSRYRCKGKRKTSIKTRLGVVEYRRNVYHDAQAEGENSYVYLLDEHLPVDKIGLVSSEVCRQAIEAVCESSYRAAARQLSENTGLSISPQGVWNIVQQLGEKREKAVERYAELSELREGNGSVESKLLYEENDGVWLKLQGKDRAESGVSKEMKIGIAYDGVLWSGGKDGKQRRTLDNKVSYASFETASEFRRHKEGIVANHYNVDEIQQRIINGDGAAWLQKRDSETDILVLDAFHRNKKITECVKDKAFAQTLRTLLQEKRIEDLLSCIEAQINSLEDESEIEGLKRLLSYYSENKAALLGYYDRNVEIVETREPGKIHHARLGSMESNVFTIVGNRMKDRRCCWSIKGGNHLAALLCLKHTTGLEGLFHTLPPLPEPEAEEEAEEYEKILPASKIPQRIGKGYTFPHSFSFLNDSSWRNDSWSLTSFSDLNLI